MIGVGFKILTHGPARKLPELPPPPPTHTHTHNHRGYTCKRVYKFKEHNMNWSTFCETKYMNRLGFIFKGQVYDWGWFQNTD